jgi:gephyrin
MRLDPRPEFHRVIIYREGPELVAHSTGGQRSSRVASLCGANGLVQLPPLDTSKGQVVMTRGSMLEAIVISEILEKL